MHNHVDSNSGVYLGGHDPLSFSDKSAFLTLAVPPVAEALVSLQRRHEAVVPAARALGHAGQFSDGHRAVALLFLTHPDR